MSDPTNSGETAASQGRGFCSNCGTRLDPAARFCHHCGLRVGVSAGAPSVPTDREAITPPVAQKNALLVWGVPTLALIAVVILVAMQFGSATPAGETGAAPLGGMVRAPDISSMSPAEQADRLFNRVMRLASEGQTDSASYFAPMALGAFEAVSPRTAHVRYDMGLVALVTGDVGIAAAQADTILAERPTHLLGLALAARAAEARGDAQAGARFRQRLVAAEPSERAAGLPEYADHDADIRAAIDLAGGR